MTPKYKQDGYRTIYADIPWLYDDNRKGRGRRTSPGGYECMSASEAMGLFVKVDRRLYFYPNDGTGLKSIASDAHLWMWVTNSFLIDGTAAMVMEAWGFKPKSLITWVKGRAKVDHGPVGAQYTGEVVYHIGMGSYARNCTEHLILGVRGNATRLLAKDIRTAYVHPRLSPGEKPEMFRELVMRASTGPYLELFARRRVAGWTQHGDQLPE